MRLGCGTAGDAVTACELLSFDESGHLRSKKPRNFFVLLCNLDSFEGGFSDGLPAGLRVINHLYLFKLPRQRHAFAVL